MYNKYKTDYYKNLLKVVSKNYKQTLNTQNKTFKQNRVAKLRTLKTNNPKEYWKLLNSERKRNNTQASLGDLFNFYKDANAPNPNEDETNDSSPENDPCEDEFQNLANEEINQPITYDELSKAVNSLKNNKSPGFDKIMNEHMKSTFNLMNPIILRLFNVILDTGIVPECWTVGNIKPIYKNKGNPEDPQNYRPITLLSNFGKLFTSIINTRLNNFAEKHDLICREQAGFRKNYSTADNIFILKSLIDIVQSQKKKIYCCFIDFKQAFDTVWRTGLWQKLIASKIHGKCFNFIQNMYNNIKSQVTTNEGSSNFFNCRVGVRQGENLSPFLFSIFLNDLDHYLTSKSVSGIELDYTEDDTYIYLKLLLLLYADDTIIFSDGIESLQHALNVFEDYCTKWKLTVNISKTKIVIFSSGRKSKTCHFQFQNNTIEIVDEYKYLGIFLGRSGSFVSTKKHVTEQANKAVFALIKKIRKLDLPIDIQVDLFNKTIKPILLYGCEIWGIGNIDMIERIQLKFYKHVLNLKKSTPSNMIYGELGITPLYIDIQTRIVSFWSKLIDNDNDKLSSSVYQIMLAMHNSQKIISPWIKFVKHLLCSLGFPVIWYSQSLINSRWLVKAVNQKLKDVFIQNWISKLDIESESNIYRLFRSHFEMSKYISILPTHLCKVFMAFRTRNHRMPVETGRWRGIPFRERICQFCNNDIGDEYHMTLVCEKFKTERIRYVKPYFYRNPNTLKFRDLMNLSNKKQLINLCLLIQIIIRASLQS